MWSNETRSLPDWVERGYEILSTEISEGDHDRGLPRESARNELVDHDDFPNDSNDADYAIDQLLNSGWLYEVADKLRVTDSER